MPLDPAIVAILDAQRKAGRPALSAGSPEDARALMRATRAALGQGPKLRDVRNLSVPTRAGAIEARLYRPDGDAAGLVVYFHGGGWVLGGLDDFDVMARTLAERSGCAVLLPDYRLAPEHPFPAGLEDALDALRWAAGRIPDLAGAAVPLIAAGDSAGGNLAAVATIELHREVAIAGQVLIYPVTDHDTGTASYREHGEGLPLTRQDMEWFFGHYVGSGGCADPRLAPLRQPDLTGLPPAVVVTAEYDVLRDEGEAYARRLQEAGNRATSRRVEGLPHGFIRLHNLVPRADRALTEIAADVAGFCAR